MTDNNTTKQIEIFRVGTHTAMNGNTHTYDEKTLQNIAQSYNPKNHEAPVVVGHPKTDSPAYGWVKALRYDSNNKALVAQIGNITNAFTTAVKNGHYKKISVALYPPFAQGNPTPQSYHLRHVGFLGGMPPAVKGLTPVHFQEDCGQFDLIEFSEQAPELETIAGLFKRLRDWLIEKEGRDVGNNLLPDWQLKWLEDKGRHLNASASVNAAACLNVSPSLTITPSSNALPPQITPPLFSQPQKEKTPMPQVLLDALEKREASIASQEQHLKKERQEFYAQKAHHDAQTFAQTMVQKGTLSPCQKEGAIDLLQSLYQLNSRPNNLDYDDLDYSEGSKASEESKETPHSMAKLFCRFLENQPPLVLFGEVANERTLDPKAPHLDTPHLDTPKDYHVDNEDIFEQIQAYAQENDIDIIAASQAIIKNR